MDIAYENKATPQIFCFTNRTSDVSQSFLKAISTASASSAPKPEQVEREGQVY